MSSHSIYLVIGSNIQPEANIRRAIELLPQYGTVQAVSGVWESHAVGSDGPNFLNVSVWLLTDIPPSDFKERLVQPIESSLGRVRTADRNAPRTVDVDVMMVDGQACHVDRWDNAFVLLPMADLLPDVPHPATPEPLRAAAARASHETWIVQRPGILKSMS